MTCCIHLLKLIIFAKIIRGIQIHEITDDLEVTISRGALVTPISQVYLYTDVEQMVFTLPDCPDPPLLSSSECNLKDQEACAFFSGLQKGLKDTSNLLSMINRIMTAKGLRQTVPSEIKVPATWLNELKGVSIASNYPQPEAITAVGSEWFSDTVARLALRKLQTNATNMLLPREKRWIMNVLAPALKMANMAYSGDITKIFSKFFVGENSILTYLTNSKMITKMEYQKFADLPRYVSELASQTKVLLFDMLNSTNNVKKLSQIVQKEIQDHAYKLSTIEDTVLLEQAFFGDIVKILFTSNAYLVHLSSFEECRANQIPISFVPPQLLHNRLIELQSSLPDHMKFAIPVDDYQLFYRLPLSECLYDSSGAIIKVNIPLVEKSSDLQLYDFRALPFAHEGHTCALETMDRLIIKDVKQNKIYTVSEPDAEFCEPRTSRLCKVPLTAADDANSFCLAVLLSGEPASTVKEACEFKCFPDTRPTLSQVTDDVFIAVHLPANQIRMECPENVFEIKSNYPHGSVRFQTVCGCKIFNQNKLLGKSTSKTCDSVKAPKVDLLIPVQMTRFQELKTFTSAGWDNTVFQDSDEIYNPNFKPNTNEKLPDNNINYTFLASSVSWNIFQSLLICYLYMRVNAITATLLTIGDNIPLVAGSDAYTCALPSDAYFLLWANLVLATLALMPGTVCKLYAFCKNMYLGHVELVAQRVARDEI